MAVPRPIVYKRVRYETNVEKGIDPECWECTSHKARTTRGYVMFNRQGFHFMHRYIYKQVYGKQPDVVLHKCGNRICINPNHLYELTKKEAFGQALPARHGRPPIHYCHESRHPISPERLAEIRLRLARGDKVSEVAYAFGLDYRTVSSLAAGETYRDIDNG